MQTETDKEVSKNLPAKLTNFLSKPVEKPPAEKAVAVNMSRVKKMIGMRNRMKNKKLQKSNIMARRRMRDKMAKKSRKRNRTAGRT